MTNRRAKLAAGATVVGLAALGGVALGTNPGPVAIQQAQGGSGQAAVVTSASGAATLPTTQNVALNSKRAPIVTRASGAPAARVEDD
jgi:hypothetical protein